MPLSAAPNPLPDQRGLTPNEIVLLKSVFADTLPYASQVVRRNVRGWGGADNSITPANIPNFATKYWCAEFTKAGATARWLFVHEFAHAWNWYHGGSNVLGAAGIWLRHERYEDAYGYDLAAHANLRDFNIEQQASIVADAYAVKTGLLPWHNKGKSAQLSDYLPFLAQVQAAGPPRGGGSAHRRGTLHDAGFKV